MQEVQRFNKVLKSLFLFGDLILLNLLLWGFNLFLGTRFWCIHCGSIFQGMTLITLCYLLCNMHSGVILHRPVVRSEQIMIRVLRNMVPFVFLSVCTLLVFHFHFSHSRYFGLFYVALTRTKNNVYLFVNKKIESIFVKEIVNNYKSCIQIFKNYL